jgi:hypothetical protein
MAAGNSPRENRRLLQVFLSHRSDSPGPGIFEVNTTPDKYLSCNCPGFAAKDSCKHTALVERRIEENSGMYPFDFSDKVSTEQIRVAMKTEQTFREFIIKHAKVEIY